MKEKKKKRDRKFTKLKGKNSGFVFHYSDSFFLKPPRFEILCDKAALLRLTVEQFLLDILLINFLKVCYGKKLKLKDNLY